LAAEAKAKTAADEAAKAAGVAANATADKETKMAAADKAKEAADEAAKAAVELRKKAGPPVTDAEARILSVTAHPLLRGTPASLPSYVPANNFSLALLDVLRDGSDAPVFSQIERTVDALPAGDLKRILSTYLREAEGDLDEFRSRIETWFDDAMDRLSGIYKRLTQWVLLILGVSLAAGLNVDSIRVANTLWAQPEMRTTLAASATKLAANNAACSPPTGNDTIKGATTNDASVPAAASTAGTTTPSPNPSQPANVSEELKKTMGCVQLLESKNLPLGWKGDELATMSLRVWLLTALGWLITALAISLGAPFWFDLLGTFTNIRAAGPTPARSDDPSTTAPGS